MQFIGAIICCLAGIRILQSIATARQNHITAKMHSQRSVAVLDEHIGTTEALLTGHNEEQLHWNGYRRFRVKQKVFESDNICSFYLVPRDGKPLRDFRPGQFLTFQFVLPDMMRGESRNVVRCYSLSDAPRKERFRITVKRVSAPDSDPLPGLISSHFHDEVQAGDLLDVQAPRGQFVLDPDGTRPVVLLGGGIGITPLLSMINSVFASGGNRDVWLFYGVCNGSEHFMKHHLQQLDATHDRFHLRVVYSQPAGSEITGIDYHEIGHLNVKLIRESLGGCDFDFFVCGPPPMMKTIVPALLDWGVAEHRIHMEAFGPATLPKTTDPVQPAVNSGRQHDQPATTVEFSRTGTRALWDGQSGSLLDFALDSGVAIEWGCRAGNCGSCEVAIKRGRVRALSKSSTDRDGGSCLTCISVPDGDVVLDA